MGYPAILNANFWNAIVMGMQDALKSLISRWGKKFSLVGYKHVWASLTYEKAHQQDDDGCGSGHCGGDDGVVVREIQVGKSYSMENYQWEQELQPYNQYEEERSSDLDNLLMQYKEVTESTQQAFKSLEIQVGKLAKEVTKFVARREENFVEVEAHEESLEEEHDSKEKDEKKVRRTCNNGISTHK
ncbi:hypothetical protein JHK86_006602 [Glycine max]|nr:hypothetical protein JHK86_006602 [Glycine max]